MREVAEDDREDHRGQQGLDDRPRRAEDRLLVQRREVALDKQHDQVAVLEGLLEVEVKQFVLRCDVGFEGGCVGHMMSYSVDWNDERAKSWLFGFHWCCSLKETHSENIAKNTLCSSQSGI